MRGHFLMVGQAGEFSVNLRRVTNGGSRNEAILNQPAAVRNQLVERHQKADFDLILSNKRRKPIKQRRSGNDLIYVACCAK